MQILLKWIENKTSAKGALYAKATIVDEATKQEYSDVTIFGNFPNFNDLRPEATITGNLKTNVYNGKTGYVLEAENQGFPKKAGGMGIKAAQERKGEMIKEAQERKNNSIAYFNAINSAIHLLEVHGGKELPDEPLKQSIIYWRDWFLSEWEKYDASTDKGIPFVN